MNVKLWSRFLAVFLIMAMSTSTASAQVSFLANTAASLKLQEKMSSRLAALAGSAELRGVGSTAQARTLSLPERGPGSLMRSGSQLMVNVRMSDISANAVQALEAAGARVVHVSERYQTVVTYIDTGNLQTVASLPAVLSLVEEFTPQTGSGDMAALSPAAAPAGSAAPAVTSCPQGATISEGDGQLKANLARANWTLDGSGVKVGVLSDSYNRYYGAVTDANADVSSGDLPGTANPCPQKTPVKVLDDSEPGYYDEGRGMLQIVHDLAPAAQLSFATAFSGLFEFADNIRNLRNNAGADIIADDVFYFVEPFFQEGPINVAISDVVKAGALYFTAAGNHNVIIGGKNVSSYEAPAYRPTACPATVHAQGALDCHNFATSGAADALSKITLGINGYVTTDFQWAEPLYGVTTDLNIYLLNSSGSIVASSADNNITTLAPFEFMYYHNLSGASADFNLVIARAAGTAKPRLKYIFLQRTHLLNAVEYNTSSGGDTVGPTLFGHSATTDGISVGAIPYDDSTVPEEFTSRGPAVFYFGPASSATPAAPITPVTMNKPDIAATDGGCTTFFGENYNPCYRFYGTSAAAPHAAAVAALILQKAKADNLPMGKSVMKWVMQSSAQAVSGGTPASVGAGMLNANMAAGQLDKLNSLSHSLFLPSIQH